jgi:hypothetical protein
MELDDHEACPEASTLDDASCVAPSRNDTVPDVTALPDEITLAVRVTCAPAFTELADNISDVLVGDGVGGEELELPPEQAATTPPAAQSRTCKIQERLRPNII